MCGDRANRLHHFNSQVDDVGIRVWFTSLSVSSSPVIGDHTEVTDKWTLFTEWREVGGLKRLWGKRRDAKDDCSIACTTNAPRPAYARHVMMAAHVFIIYVSGLSSRPATSSFDNGSGIPATPGWCSLIVECGHRGREPRKGDLEYHTSQSCFWFCWCCSHYDQSGFASHPPDEL